MTDLPSLRSDRAFWGITTTQFLGAFNDNVFKMLLLLICTDYVRLTSDSAVNPYFDPYQTIASLLFAFAFVTFTGLAGFLSDRFPKRELVIACKVAEILVMGAGFVVFLIGTPGSFSFIALLFFVLFLMGTQSAFFGPSKYGILPEMFSDTDLPTVNAVVVATTFLAIIFGTALGGWLKSVLGDELWLISMVCVGLAVLGTATATLLRKTPAAQPDLKFAVRSWFNEPKVWRIVLRDRLLFRVLLVYSVFWFVGGVVALTITLVGQIQLELDSTITSLFNAAVGLGIGIGSIWAARLSKKELRLTLVSRGSIGVFAASATAAIVAILPIDITVKSAMFGTTMIVIGFFGGWVAIPLQVYIQAHPRAEYKGRVVAVMNLMTWIGILLASVYYFGALAITQFKLDPSWILLSTGTIMLLTGTLSRLRTTEHLRNDRSES